MTQAETLREAYRRFNLPIDATPDDVTAAFRRLSKSTHPDRGGSHDDFALLQRNRDLLLRTSSDPAYRTQIMRATAQPNHDSDQPDRVLAAPWRPGLYPALALMSTLGLLGLVQGDTSRIANGAVLAGSVWLIVTVVLQLRRVHQQNLAAASLYQSAEDLLKFRDLQRR